MPSSSDFRADAVRFAALARASTDPEIIKNLQERERSSNTLADNAQWLVDHEGHTVRRSDNKEITGDEAAIDRWNAEGGLENDSGQ